MHPPLVLCFQGQLWSISQEMWLQEFQCLSFKHRIQETTSDLKQIDEAVLQGSTSSYELSPEATVPSVCSAKVWPTYLHVTLPYKELLSGLLQNLFLFFKKSYFIFIYAYVYFSLCVHMCQWKPESASDPLKL